MSQGNVFIEIKETGNVLTGGPNEWNLELKTITVHNPDLRYSIVGTVFSHRVHFKIYQIIGFIDKDLTKPIWNKKDSHRVPDPVHTLEEAQIFMEGSVKWDGCSDWHLHGYENVVSIHRCDRKSLLRIGELMAYCWDLAAEHSEAWEGQD